MLEVKAKACSKVFSPITFTIVLLLFLLSGCGQYGSLYLPDIPSVPKNQSDAQREKPVINEDNNA